MKKVILMIIISAVLFPVFSQTIFSNGTGGGDWSSASTWMGGIVPGANSDVFIAGTDSVATTTNAICKNLTVMSGGKLATGVDSVSVAETFELEADAFFYNSTTKSTVPGTIRILNDASTVVHSGSGTVGGPTNNQFGNLIIKRAEGSTPGANLTIKGNLVIQMAGASIVFRGCRPATGSQTHTVYGNVIINMGTLSCIDVGDNTFVGGWNIKGDVIIAGPDSRFSCFSSANAAGLAIYNIDGNIINNGGRIQAGTSSSAGPGTGIINLKGNLTINSGTFGTNSLGPYAINFVKNGVQNFYLRGVNLNLNTNLHDTVKTGSTLVMDLDTCKWGSSTGGDFVVEGTLELMNVSRLTGLGTFNLQPNAILRIGSTDGITATAMLGSIQMTGGRNYSPEANYIYSGGAGQVFGDGLPGTVKALVISNPNGLTLTNDITISGTLALTNGSLDLGGKVITLGTSATLIENPGKTVKGINGKIMTTRDIGTPSSLNVGGLGAVLTSANNFGNTTIERYHSSPKGSGNAGIFRIYNIAPANNSGLNATLRFHYDESELNSIPEGDLMFVRSPNGTDNSWYSAGGVVNQGDNYVEASGINEFSYWSLAGRNTPLPVKEESADVPKDFSLYQNYPNPFNPTTNIQFDLPKRSFVNLLVYNVLGEKVSELINEYLEAGSHQITFGDINLTTGIYLYRIVTEDFSFTRKMNLIK